MIEHPDRGVGENNDLSGDIGENGQS